jgi:hypothetical protein
VGDVPVSGAGETVLGGGVASFGSTATRAMFNAPTKQIVPTIAAATASQRKGRRQEARLGRSILKVRPT